MEQDDEEYRERDGEADAKKQGFTHRRISGATRGDEHGDDDRGNQPFELMVYPGRSHSISEGAGTSLHVYSLIARYMVEHLPAGPR